MPDAIQTKPPQPRTSGGPAARPVVGEHRPPAGYIDHGLIGATVTIQIDQGVIEQPVAVDIERNAVEGAVAVDIQRRLRSPPRS